MTDFLLELGLSNVLISLALAIIAMLVGTISRRPQILYLLWLLVLVKLVTPSVVAIPVVTIPEQIDSTLVSMEGYSKLITGFTENKRDTTLSAETWFAFIDKRKKGLSLLWLMGSVVVFAVSLLRVIRFNRLLRKESDVALQKLQATAARIANRLGLKTVPTIYTTSAHLSPMVWWIGGKVRVVIPAALHEQMDARQFEWILAHELAHLRRRDYLVRWIEWLACVCFWWNPVVWWTRQNLRANEELCCDALVVSDLNLNPQTYANSLLKAVECIVYPVLRPPVMASEINSGGFLKRRFKMIVSGKLKQSNSRWVQTCILLCALVVLSLGLGCERDNAVNNSAESTIEESMKIAEIEDSKQVDWDAVRMKIEAAVEAGEITREQADAKYRAIRQKMSQEVMVDGIDWGTAKKTAPEDWPEELKAQIVAAGYDLEQIAERIRKYQQEEATRTKQDTDIEDIGRRIRAAVERGELTPEKGREKMEYARQAAGTSSERKIDLDTVKQELAAAVESGRITQEQADARLDALMKRLKGEK